jgi:hypothetical protein
MRDRRVLAGFPFQGLDLPGPVLRVPPFTTAQMQEVQADGAGGLAAAGGELKPELSAFVPIGQDQEAGEGQGAAGVAGGVEAGDAAGGVGVVEDALAQVALWGGRARPAGATG